MKIRGTRGRDMLDDTTAGPGDDLFLGLGGSDTLVSAAGTDTLDGDRGFDLADFSGRADRVVVDLGAGGELRSGTVLARIEGVVGTTADDRLIGHDGADRLLGGSGDDVLRGARGADTLGGGAGGNLFAGGGGFDKVDYSGAAGPVVVDLAAGTGSAPGASDTLLGVQGVIGSAFSDGLSGDGRNNCGIR